MNCQESPTLKVGEYVKSEVHKRNEALVAITRAKVWCVVTGVESPIFTELRQYQEQFPYLIFPAFNKTSLKRVTDDEDEEDELINV